MKYLVFLLLIVVLSGCGMISKQYYYVPSVAHQQLRNRDEHRDFKMIYSKVAIRNAGGDSIGSVTSSNGVGHPLLMGPVVPVIPVGGFFQKRSSRFEMDVNIRSNNGYLMPMAIDSNDYKKKRDSLNALKVGKVQQLSSQCYMIVNDTVKVPLKVEEFFLGNTGGHSYRIDADIKFRKVKTMKLVTGNAILDSTFKKITFKRKSRIKYDFLMLGY